MNERKPPVPPADNDAQPNVGSDRDAEPEAESEALQIKDIEKLEDDAKGG